MNIRSLKPAYRTLIPKLKRGAALASWPKADPKSGQGGFTMKAKGNGLSDVDAQEFANDLGIFLADRSSTGGK